MWRQASCILAYLAVASSDGFVDTETWPETVVVHHKGKIKNRGLFVIQQKQTTKVVFATTTTITSQTATPPEISSIESDPDKSEPFLETRSGKNEDQEEPRQKAP